ncbi:MAG: SDR family oxidoreductase [Alphaproteobacteria bacterium]|nr:SDR family oxidoreductase [Alphaproteobacteria bacterium]
MTKITLITGGSRGLGKNTALHLAQKGRDIILTYLSQKKEAEKVVEAIRDMGQKAVALQLDITKVNGFEQFVMGVKNVLKDVWGREDFDILINNAGTGIHNDYMKTSEEEFDRMVNEHVKAPFFLSQKLLPIMVDGGRILNFSSGLTRFTNPGFTAYATMKAAVEVLSVYMAKELGARGITVNVIAPGAIETDFGGGAVRDNAGLNQHIASSVALGRAGMPDDIGGAIAAILDDDAGWINAQRIEVSGGQMI